MLYILTFFFSYLPILIISRLDETGNLNHEQYWSENHQICWKSGKHLIGQAFANNIELENMIFEASNSNGTIAKEIGGMKSKSWLQYRSRY